MFFKKQIKKTKKPTYLEVVQTRTQDGRRRAYQEAINQAKTRVSWDSGAGLNSSIVHCDTHEECMAVISFFETEGFKVEHREKMSSSGYTVEIKW